jgi:hypothetical protein
VWIHSEGYGFDTDLAQGWFLPTMLLFFVGMAMADLG